MLLSRFSKRAFSTVFRNSNKALSNAPTVARLLTETQYNDDIKTVDVEASILQTSQEMVKYHIGALLVTKNSPGTHHLMLSKNVQVCGILSERDVVRAHASSLGSDACVKEIMTPVEKIKSVEMHDDIYSCLNEMLHLNIRHLAVKNKKDQIIGLFSMRDVMKGITIHLQEDQVPLC